MVMVAINHGAADESNSLKGISHFIEHMCFKGTKNRSNYEISSTIDNVGGVLNAYTDWEITAYWAKVGNTYKNLAIDVISDLALNPIFPNKEIKKEREVIIQELKMYEDNPNYHVYDIFNEQLFNKNSGYYLPIIGTTESLQRINRKEIVSYYKKNYVAPILIVIGDVPNKNSIDLLYDYKGIHRPANLNNNPKDKILSRTGITQSTMLMGNLIKPKNTTKYIEQNSCLQLLDAVYSDMSGRLFKTIREKHHLVYSVHFSFSDYANDIMWCVTAGLDKNKIDFARDLVVKELIKPLTKKEIKLALQKAIGSREMIVDNITNIANITAYAATQGIDYQNLIFNYEKNLKQASKNVNEFIKEMNFKNNLLTAIVPSK